MSTIQYIGYIGGNEHRFEVNYDESPEQIAHVTREMLESLFADNARPYFPVDVGDEVDDEEFCDICFAGITSSEHLASKHGENAR